MIIYTFVCILQVPLPDMINVMISGLMYSLWHTNMNLANLTAFNRFCNLYMSCGRYEYTFSVKNVNRMLAAILLYQIVTFAATQVPGIGVLFNTQRFTFVYRSVDDTPIIAVVKKHTLVNMLTDIVLTTVWYILVYAKVKKQVIY